MDYVLAVDGGGTKTQVSCADLNGKVVGEGLTGSTNLTTVAIGAASMNLLEGIRQATSNLPAGWKIKKMVMGIAGLDTPTEVADAVRVFSDALHFLNIEKMVLLNDVVVALHSGTDRANAMALIAGTGSNCYGQNDQKQTAKVGGVDFLLSDEGSGYAIGQAVLRAAVKSFDGRAPKTILENLVAEHFQIASIAELKNVVYHPLIEKAEVAQVAKICTTAFAENDLVAKSIFDQAVLDLNQMARTVISRLNFVSPFDCVLVGGVFKVEYIRQSLETVLRNENPQINIVLPNQPPVAGALKLALATD